MTYPVRKGKNRLSFVIQPSNGDKKFSLELKIKEIFPGLSLGLGCGGHCHL